MSWQSLCRFVYVPLLQVDWNSRPIMYLFNSTCSMKILSVHHATLKWYQQTPETPRNTPCSKTTWALWPFRSTVSFVTDDVGNVCVNFMYMLWQSTDFLENLKTGICWHLTCHRYQLLVFFGLFFLSNRDNHLCAIMDQRWWISHPVT